MKIEKSKIIVLSLSILIVFCIVLFSVINHYKIKNSIQNSKIDNGATQELLVFIQDGCYYCKDAELFLANQKFKNLKLTYHNLKDRESQILLFSMANKFNISKKNLGTPIFFINNEYVIGFNNKNQKQLIDIFKKNGNI